ncbi:hypothetical protein [Hymenobacter sp. UYP22]|uniref:hypothetical protein n=1 Tax=Hymenobacter sp. UYP22 TaxID=3156348 RepID=UPI0033965220
MRLLQLSTIIALCLLLIDAQSVHAQVKVATPYSVPSELAPLLKFFQERRVLYQNEDKPLVLPLLFAEDNTRVGMNFKIVMGDKPLGLLKREMVLKNPFAASSFPLSYSIIYQAHLVTLFEPGNFACYNIKTLARNQLLEKQLNKRKFQYHWLLGNQLVGLSGGQYWVQSSVGTWVPYTKPVPFLSKQPKLFEDEHYLSFPTCNGEFGGEVYFYNKQTGQYYLTGATCPNSIIKRNGQYQVLASLGHGGGSSRLQIINAPAKLTRMPPRAKPSPADLVLPEHRQKEVALRVENQTLFYYYGIQMFGSFLHKDQQLFVVRWTDRTFLATVKNHTITIVDPLFNRSLYTHQPVTTSYGPNLSLMNMDFYGLAREKEVSCMLLAGNQIVRIDWGKKRDANF